jgi:hypothetical protein
MQVLLVCSPPDRIEVRADVADQLRVVRQLEPPPEMALQAFLRSFLLQTTNDHKPFDTKLWGSC